MVRYLSKAVINISLLLIYSNITTNRSVTLYDNSLQIGAKQKELLFEYYPV